MHSEPSLMERPVLVLRQRAAQAALLAGLGLSADSVKLEPRQKAELRWKALAWLRAELTAWEKQLQGADNQTGDLGLVLLRCWLFHHDLAPVRDTLGWGVLNRDEQQAWQELWHDVHEVVRKAIH
jgi:hypothetical protein